MLLKNGVPFEVVELLDDTELNAYFITFQEIESGKQFSWSTMSWPDLD